MAWLAPLPRARSGSDPARPLAAAREAQSSHFRGDVQASDEAGNEKSFRVIGVEILMASTECPRWRARGTEPLRPAAHGNSIRLMVTVADTAFSIAVVRAEEGARPPEERLFADPYASLFRPEGADVIEATQRYVDLPFFREGVRLRTRFIDDAVREHVAGGLRQVVILGAGFDTRGLRMPELERARVFEVDFAEQLARKRALLAAGGVSLPDTIAHAGCDFEGDWEPRLLADLAAHGFRAGAGALFVWEGVIGYIDSPAIDRSLAFMVRAGGRGTRVVFSFAQPAIDPDTVEQRTNRAGFTRVEDVGCDELWRRHLPGEPHPVAAILRLGIASV